MSNYGAVPIPDAKKVFDITTNAKFVNLPNSNAMEWVYPDGNVIKLANRKDKTNVLIKYDLPP